MYFFYVLPIILFFYILYKLVKDDYLLIRKNVSPEQVFDIAFWVLAISLLSGRSVALLEQGIVRQEFFFSFFSSGTSGLSLTGVCLSGVIGLYVIVKHRRVPLGRLFDFFSLSFLSSLPPLFLYSALILHGFSRVLAFYNGLAYIFVLVICFKLLYPKLMNRTIRDGTLALFFLIFFSVTSFFSALFPQGKLSATIDAEKIMVILLFILSVVCLFISEHSALKGRRIR
jgi:hypothetical protein